MGIWEPKFFLYSVLGLLTTFISLMFVINRLGWAILLLTLIFIYIKDRKVGFLIFYNLFLFCPLFYNPKLYSSFSPFIFGNFLMSYSWLDKGFQMLDQLFWLFLIIVIFIETVINKRQLGNFYARLLLLTLILAVLLVIGTLSGVSIGEEILGGVAIYTGFFLALIAFPLMRDSKEGYSFIFKYTLYTISVFEIFIFLIGWLPKMLFNYGQFSGDFVTLSLNTVTTAIYILGIAVIYYYFDPESEARLPLLILLSIIILLGQSVAQTVLLLGSIVFVQFMWGTRSRIFAYSLGAFLIILLMIVGYNFAARYFPYMKRMLLYAEIMYKKFLLLGIKNNPKIVGFSMLFSHLSGEHLLFGYGNGVFAQDFGKAEFLNLVKGAGSMATTIFTPMNRLIYDFGIVPFMAFFSGFFFILKELKKTFNVNRVLGIVAFGVLFYILFSYFLFPLVESSVVSMVAAIVINGAIQNVEK